MEASTSLQYWLRWKVAMCSLSLLAGLGFSAYLLRRYEGPGLPHQTEVALEGGKRRVRNPGVVGDGEAWLPYLQKIHPRWLLAYRLVSFLFFTMFTVIIIKSRGYTILYFYTEWTFLLVTIYFGLATLLSINGCSKIIDSNESNGEDTGEVAGFGGYLLQITYQTCVGAAMLTDSVFWCVIFPVIITRHYGLDYLVVVMHSVNVVFLLGEAVLNSLQFPMFRIAYVCLWTCLYIIFQWILHASTPVWWPYQFLNLSSKFAPLWYVVIGFLQVPCYLGFGLVIKLKHHLFSKFPKNRCSWSSCNGEEERAEEKRIEYI